MKEGKTGIANFRFIFCMFKITFEKYLMLKYSKDSLTDIPADIKIEEIKQAHKDVGIFMRSDNSYNDMQEFMTTCSHCLTELIKEHK